MAQLINSLLAYAVWSEKEHSLTGEAVREGGEAELALWTEVIRDFGKPRKTGAFFDHAVARLLRERAEKLDEPPAPS